MDVSFVVVSYNGAEFLKRCLHSIYKYTEGLEFEVIVVENASQDSSPEIVERDFPEALLIKNLYNIGFGAAANIGVERARGKYIFFLNPDAHLRNNAALKFFDFMERKSGSRIGIAGAWLSDSKGLPVHCFADFIDVYRELSLRYRAVIRKLLNIKKGGLLPKKRPKVQSAGDYLVVNYVTGADLFMRKKLFHEFSGFDSAYFVYAEEMDLQYRIMKSGFTSVIIDGPEIQHDVGKSFTIKNQRRIMMTVGRLTFVKKQYNWVSHLALKIGMLISIAIELVADLYYREYQPKENAEFFFKVLREQYH